MAFYAGPRPSIPAAWDLTDAGDEIGNDGVNGRFDQIPGVRVFDEEFVVPYFRTYSGELDILGQ